MKYSFLIFIISFLFFSCENSKARKPIVRKTSSFMKESVLFNKNLNLAEEKIIGELIKLDSLNTYITSSNGFWYKAKQRDSVRYLPKFGDQITYNYEVYDLQSNVIYSFEEVGEQLYIVDQQEIVEGLRNGLKLMGEGDIFTFLFPSHKVFGYLGDEKKIEINQPLIYKVQLNKINKKNESN